MHFVAHFNSRGPHHDPHFMVVVGSVVVVEPVVVVGSVVVAYCVVVVVASVVVVDFVMLVRHAASPSRHVCGADDPSLPHCMSHDPPIPQQVGIPLLLAPQTGQTFVVVATVKKKKRR